MPRSSISQSPAVAWSLYDFAYSLFIFTFAVRFFPSWMIDDLGRPDWYVGVSQTAVVLVVVIAMPLLGAAADQLGRRKPFLLLFTVMACVFCAALSFVSADGSVLPVLLAAGAAVGCGQLAFAHFDPLLANVADQGERGRVSGLAVALGFIGVLFGLAVVGELIVGEGDKQRAFLPTALLFLIFALPALLVIHEPEPKSPGTPVTFTMALNQLVTTLQGAHEHQQAFRFLLGRLLYSDAIVTVGGFLAVYMTRLGGFSEREKTVVIGAGVVSAALGAVTSGRIVDRIGPKRPLLTVLPIVSAALLVAAFIAQPWTAWLISTGGGLAIGVIWTADRVMMLKLAPPSLRGQFFAFFNLANRLASALGPILIWSGTVWLLHQQTGWLTLLDASRVAIAGLAGTALVGWAVIRPIRDEGAPRGIGH